MATIGKLIVEIGLNNEGLKKGLAKSRGLISGAADKFKTVGKKAMSGAAVAGGVLATSLGTVAVTAGVVGGAALDMANQIDTATGQIAAGLGISQEAAGAYEDEMKGIFANNFGEDFEDIAASLVTVERGLDELNPASLQKVTEQALALRDNFETDVFESVDAASVLMEEFGLTGVQAMDFLAKGLQDIPADDLLDTIREYGNQFGDAGFSADQFFSIMKSGAAGGVLGTDKIADAVKEMTIILNEGGDGVPEAFSALGLDFAQIQGEVASGQAVWADYFGAIVSGLQGVEDPIQRGQLQVALFGTMAEDLGPSFLEGLDPAAVKLSEIAGATDSLNARYDNLGSALEGLKRQGLVALAPLGQGILELVNEFMPDLVAFVNGTLRPAIERFGKGAIPLFRQFGEALKNTVGPAMALINDALTRINVALGGTGEGVDLVSLGLGALKLTMDAVIVIIQATALAFQGVAWGVEQVAGAIRSSLKWWDSLKERASGLDLSLPEWLRPGSPPPLAFALRDIRAGLRSLPNLDEAFSFKGQMPLAASGVSGGQAGSSVTVNVGSVSARTETNGDPVHEAIRMTVELLERELRRGG